MSDPSIREIIENLPLRKGVDIDALTEETTALIDNVKHAKDADIPKPGVQNKQWHGVAKAVKDLDAALSELHWVTEEMLWTDVNHNAVLDDFDQYPTADEVRAFLEPIRKSAEKLESKKLVSKKGFYFIEQAFTYSLAAIFSKATGKKAGRRHNWDSGKDYGPFLDFVTQVAPLANIALKPANLVRKYSENK